MTYLLPRQGHAYSRHVYSLGQQRIIYIQISAQTKPLSPRLGLCIERSVTP